MCDYRAEGRDHFPQCCLLLGMEWHCKFDTLFILVYSKENQNIAVDEFEFPPSPVITFIKLFTLPMQHGVMMSALLL
jgi:hypothetical protein